MDIIKPDFQNKNSKRKFSEINEEGEISFHQGKNVPSSIPWQAKFLKVMILLLLIVTFVLTLFRS